MNKFEIRKKFEELIGKDRFIGFLGSVQSSKPETGRLKYKQELEWNEFCVIYQIHIKEFRKIFDLFQYCYLHNEEFQIDTVPIIYGTMRTPNESELKFVARTFPNANVVAYGPCWIEAAKHKTVSFCSKCREELQKNSGNMA